MASTRSACFTTCLRYRSKYGKCSSSGYFSGGVFSKSHSACLVKLSACECTRSISSYGTAIASAALRQAAISSSEAFALSGWRSAASAAERRFCWAIRLV